MYSANDFEANDFEDDFDLSTSKAGPSSLTGNMNGTQKYTAVPAASVKLDTLDEPVSQTLLRDLKAVWSKLKQVLLPIGANKNILKDWDLWGPLLLCLILSIRLSITAPESQSSVVFAGVFVIVWCGAGVVTLNSKLLGGKLSFFQSVCVLGYCIFPLVIASIVTFFVKYIVVRAIICILAFAWSAYASMGFISDVQLDNKRFLALYPMFLFYFVIAWMVSRCSFHANR